MVFGSGAGTRYFFQSADSFASPFNFRHPLKMGFEVVVIDGEKYIFRPINRIDYTTLREVNTFFNSDSNPLIISGNSFYPNFKNKGVDGVLISYPQGKIASVRLSPLQMKRVFMEMLSVYPLIGGNWSVDVNDFYYYYYEETLHAMIYPKFDINFDEKISLQSYTEVLYQLLVSDNMRNFPLSLRDLVNEDDFEDWISVLDTILTDGKTNISNILQFNLFKGITIPTNYVQPTPPPARFTGNATIYKGVISIVEKFKKIRGIGLEPFFTALDIYVKCHANDLYIPPELAIKLTMIYFGYEMPDLDVGRYTPIFEAIGGKIQDSPYKRLTYVDELLVFYYYQVNYISDYFVAKNFNNYIISSRRKETVDFPDFLEMDLPKSIGLLNIGFE